MDQFPSSRLEEDLAAVEPLRRDEEDGSIPDVTMRLPTGRRNLYLAAFCDPCARFLRVPHVTVPVYRVGPKIYRADAHHYVLIFLPDFIQIVQMESHGKTEGQINSKITESKL
ncbi:uncharacterized protein LOC103517521 [Diaphorina citri]|uniref:Uncharacterized protein LOC103517521 n=1 Tax=Diaphorina citri TaxID=121845 RepID=A0A3Q0JFC8_DIACI|nr:uncharacterized protein LOC103517521 [Diaphorina citri]